MQQRQQSQQQRRNNSQLNFTITGYKSFLLFLLLVYVSRDSSAENASAAAAADAVNDIHGKTVKKELKEKPEPVDTPVVPPAEVSHINDDEAKQKQQNSNVIVISESTLAELQAAKEKQKKKTESMTDSTEAAHSIDVKGQMQVEESSFKIFHSDMDMSDSYKTGFYFFLGLSCAGIALIMYKIFRMRLSRAERKYGVQGDRSNQELTPLPVSIEDGNSDEEDQTLFEINRQQLRIL